METQDYFDGCLLVAAEADLGAVTLNLPPTPGVCLFTTEQDHPILLLYGGNLRAQVRRRLAEEVARRVGERIRNAEGSKLDDLCQEVQRGETTLAAHGRVVAIAGRPSPELALSLHSPRLSELAIDTSVLPVATYDVARTSAFPVLTGASGTQ